MSTGLSSATSWRETALPIRGPWLGREDLVAIHERSRHLKALCRQFNFDCGRTLESRSPAAEPRVGEHPRQPINARRLGLSALALPCAARGTALPLNR